MMTDNRTNEQIVKEAIYMGVGGLVGSYIPSYKAEQAAAQVLVNLRAAGRLAGEPSETQVKLAYLAHLKAPRTRGMDVYGPMRAALAAAARVAPQAESEYAYCPIHGDLLAANRSYRCGNAPTGHEYAAPVKSSSTVDEAALIREAKAEARGEALIDAAQAHRKLHETYGSTSVCHGGIGGQAMTPHCAEICDNINAHLTETSAWAALELEAVEFSRARAAEYRKAVEL